MMIKPRAFALATAALVLLSGCDSPPEPANTEPSPESTPTTPVVTVAPDQHIEVEDLYYGGITEVPVKLKDGRAVTCLIYEGHNGVTMNCLDAVPR